MNEGDAARILTIASGLDNRDVTDAAILAWSAALADVPFEVARDAVFAHVRGPQRHEYLTAAHIVDYAEFLSGEDAKLEAGYVKTARGLGLVDGWPDRLDSETRAKVIAWRQSNQAMLESPADPVPFALGHVGKEIPS